MPMYRNPKFAYVEPGGGGGGLVAAAVVVVACGAGLIWLARELARIWVELAVIAGGTTVIMGGWLIWMAGHFNRGRGPVRAAPPARGAAVPAAIGDGRRRFPPAGGRSPSGPAGNAAVH